MDIDLFSAIPLFADLTPSEREDLGRLLQPLRFDAHHAVFWIGEPGDEFFIIESGQVVICYPDEHGEEKTLAVLGPGHFFGELSLLDGGRRTATARAQTESRLLSLGREAFHDFLKKHPISAIHILSTIGRRQRDSLDKLRGIKNANEVVEEQRTPVQRMAERVSAIITSGPFVILNTGFFLIWILVNTLRHPTKINWHDDPPTFFTLGFLITLEAIILSMFVLNSQKRQAKRDAIKADLDYQINRKAHLEITQLHEKLDRLETMVAGLAGNRGPGGVTVAGTDASKSSPLPARPRVDGETGPVATPVNS
jgi:CRP/FNR family transcriptional regulator, cyclic AMP receptor protein